MRRDKATRHSNPSLQHAIARRAAAARLWTAVTTLALVGALTAAPVRAGDVSPDAVIELWEQHWTLNPDGTTVYHLKQHVRLNQERAYGEFGDLRITYNKDTDQLDVLVARVKRPDGTYLPLPDYGYVRAAPGETAGWPAFAGIWQQVLVMSGLEPGCVVELEYRITSRPVAQPAAADSRATGRPVGQRSVSSGAAPDVPLTADLRLDHRYPVRKRVIRVTTPPAVDLKHAITGLAADAFGTETREQGGQRTATWTFGPLPESPDEPHAPPWQTRCPRLAFSTAGDVEAWLHATLAPIAAADGDADGLIARLAREWTKDRFEPADKLRALQEKLAATFNFVEFDAALRPHRPRSPSEVLRSNYGLPEEAAAALLALARAADVPAHLGVLVRDDVWLPAVPQKASVAAYVLVRNVEGEAEIWEPRRGRVLRDGPWAGHTLLTVGASEPRRLHLPPWGDDESRCTVAGTVKIADDGNFSGQVTLRTTGLFVSADGLRTADAQKARATTLLGRVLPGCTVESLTVKTLAPGEWEATATIKSAKPLKKVGGAFSLVLAQDGPFLADVPLPLAHSERKYPVRLPGPFQEQIDLVLEWPDKWKVQAGPLDVTPVETPAGHVWQEVVVEKNRLTLRRYTRCARRELTPAEFLSLRGGLNAVRAEAARTLLLAP